MKALELLCNKRVSPIVRNILQKAVDKLAAEDYSHIEVTHLELRMIANALGQEPVKARTADFIRIYDELDNGIDIQVTRYDWLLADFKLV